MTVEAAPPRDPLALNEEERSVRDTVREWAQREVAPGAAERDEEERYDRDLFERAGELGLAGLPYPEKYGGAGMGTFAWTLAAEEIAAADMGMAVSLSVHVLSQLCIFANGTDEQKERFLPPMTAGRELGAFALTEPGAGSDAASLALAAVRDGDEYRLTGTKIWITNAGEAARYIVFATVDRSAGKAGITAFIVDADTPGFRLGSKERKMGIRGTTGYEIVFDDARRAQGRAVGARSRPHQHRGRVHRPGAQRPRAGGPLRAPATPVRPCDRRPGDDPGHAGRDGGRGRGGTAADLARRSTARRRPADRCAVEHGEVVRVGRRHARHDGRRADLRRRRLFPG